MMLMKGRFYSPLMPSVGCLNSLAHHPVNDMYVVLLEVIFLSVFLLSVLFSHDKHFKTCCHPLRNKCSCVINVIISSSVAIK